MTAMRPGHRPDEAGAESGLPYWERRIMLSARICRRCYARRYIWHDARGRVWAMCIQCDVDPKNPPRV